MIVCVCRNVSDTVLKKAAADGARTLEDVRKVTPVGGCCGRCHQTAQDTLDQAVASLNSNMEMGATIAISRRCKM